MLPFLSNDFSCRAEAVQIFHMPSEYCVAFLYVCVCVECLYWCVGMLTGFGLSVQRAGAVTLPRGIN